MDVAVPYMDTVEKLMLTVVLDARVGLVFVELKALLTKTPKQGNSLGRDISTTEYSALSVEDELILRLVVDKGFTAVITLSVGILELFECGDLGSGRRKIS